ncbi:MAG: hypothetical protein H0T62_12255 [Parachlamydiaceae bacterium]|nr:hypothetical protein [Parachlamydiaceae bacterium]
MITNYMPVPYDTHLNFHQMSIIDNPSEEYKITRAYECVREHPHMAFRVLVPSANTAQNINIYAHCLFYSAAWLWIPVCVISELAKLAPTTPVIFGTAAIAGLVIFESVVIISNIYTIQNSAPYINWEKQHTELFQNNYLIDFFNKDDICAYLLCPISNAIPKMPAKVDNNDLTYDYHTALDWIVNRPNEFLPGDYTLRKIEDLKFDYSHINTFIVRLDKLGTILNGEKIRRICRIIDVKLMSEELKAFLFIVDYCSLTGLASLGELFGSKCKSTKKSFDQLDKLFFIVLNFNFTRRAARLREFKDEYKKIKELPFISPQQKKIYDNQIVDLSTRSSSIKRIEIESKSDSKIAEFLYRFLGENGTFKIFGFKRSFRITRDIKLHTDIDSQIWGVPQIYFGSNLIQLENNKIYSQEHVNGNLTNSSSLEKEPLKTPQKMSKTYKYLGDDYEIISESESESDILI